MSKQCFLSGNLLLLLFHTPVLAFWSKFLHWFWGKFFLLYFSVTLNCLETFSVRQIKKLFELTCLLVTLFSNQSIRTKLNKTGIMKLCTILFFGISLCKIYGQVLKWQWNKSKSKMISYQNFRKTVILCTFIKTNTN